MKVTDTVGQDIGVVVVTFNPGEGIEARLRMMSRQGTIFVVVDNASGTIDRSRLEGACRDHGWELIANQENLGLGTALNQGVRRLAERGFKWALLFDQDSEPANDFSAALIASRERHLESGSVAVIGASFVDARSGQRHRVLMRRPGFPGVFRKAEVGEVDLPDVSVVITSGSLVRIADFERLGGFDETLFIDYLDTDYCLRCRQHGRRIAVSAAARLAHSLGTREKKQWLGLSVTPTNHSALRHYYIARNRIRMVGRHAWHEPHWFFFDCAAAALWLFRVLAAESQKMDKLRAMLIGTWDGFLGRSGKCPAGRV